MGFVDFSKVTFVDSNQRPVEYDGSPVSWRVSAYSVVKENNSIFLINGQGEDFYDLPGGGVELGEKVEDTLKREAREEGGIEIEPVSLINFYQDFFYHRKEKKFYQTMLLFFESKLINTLFGPTDPVIEFAQFVPMSELDKYPMLDYVEKVVRQVA